MATLLWLHCCGCVALAVADSLWLTYCGCSAVAPAVLLWLRGRPRTSCPLALYPHTRPQRGAPSLPTPVLPARCLEGAAAHALAGSIAGFLHLFVLLSPLRSGRLVGPAIIQDRSTPSTRVRVFSCMPHLQTHGRACSCACSTLWMLHQHTDLQIAELVTIGCTDWVQRQALVTPGSSDDGAERSHGAER